MSLQRPLGGGGGVFARAVPCRHRVGCGSGVPETSWTCIQGGIDPLKL